MKHLLFPLFVIHCSLFTHVGCAPSGSRTQTEYVEGIVSVDGTPLDKATITFSPVGEGESASGYSDANGKYVLSSINGEAEKGAVAGDYNVSVTKVKVTKLEKGDPRVKKDKVTGQDLLTHTEQLTAPVYWSASTTPLKITVAKGKNKLNSELKSKP